MSKRFSVGRVDGQRFVDSTKRTYKRRWFATHDEAATYIGSLPDQTSVEHGDYYLDAPQNWLGL